MQSVGVPPLGVGGGFDHFCDRLREVFSQVADVPPSFFGATENALGMHLLPEGDYVRGLVDLVQRLVPWYERLAGVGVDEGLMLGFQTGNRPSA